jgi:hypothetical protein
MTKRMLGLLLASVAMVAFVPVHGAEKSKKLTCVEKNSYGSECNRLSDSKIQITTRKKVQGTLDEVNTSGTTTNKAYQLVLNAAVFRAALEARGLGFKALKVSATHDLSQTSERQSASSCPGNICQKDFTFAPGAYITDVELAIEITYDLLKEVPADLTDVIDADRVLKQYGM